MKKKYKVLTPNEGFNGKRYGVLFEDGVGHATKEQANELVNVWGYECKELTGVNPEPKEKTDPEANGSRSVEPWQSAVKAVKEIDNAEDLKAFTVDEDREIVLKARDTRLEELASEDVDSEEQNSKDDAEPAGNDSEKENSEEDTEGASDSEEEKGSE